jgi:hypothetical protein
VLCPWSGRHEPMHRAMINVSGKDARPMARKLEPQTEENFCTSLRVRCIQQILHKKLFLLRNSMQRVNFISRNMETIPATSSQTSESLTTQCSSIRATYTLRFILPPARIWMSRRIRSSAYHYREGADFVYMLVVTQFSTPRRRLGRMPSTKVACDIPESRSVLVTASRTQKPVSAAMRFRSSLRRARGEHRLISAVP